MAQQRKTTRETREPVVCLVDVDNTLLDNDQAERDYRRELERQCGAEVANRYWAIFEEIRRELGYADYLGALQRYRRLSSSRWTAPSSTRSMASTGIVTSR